MNKRQGFTLIELLIVIAIIGILSTMLIIQFGNTRGTARDAKRASTLQQLQIAIELYYEAKGFYPDTGGTPLWRASDNGGQVPFSDDYIPGLVSEGFVRALPTDPLGGLSPHGGSCGNMARAYVYSGRLNQYKLMSHCAMEGNWDPDHELADPSGVRTHTWVVCSDATTCATW